MDGNDGWTGAPHRIHLGTSSDDGRVHGHGGQSEHQVVACPRDVDEVSIEYDRVEEPGPIEDPSRPRGQQQHLSESWGGLGPLPLPLLVGVRGHAPWRCVAAQTCHRTGTDTDTVEEEVSDGVLCVRGGRRFSDIVRCRRGHIGTYE